MSAKGLRGVIGVAATPFTDGPVVWSNAPGDQYPRGQGGALINTPYIDFNLYASHLSYPCRQGAVRIQMTRTSAYPLTASDGNPDVALKIMALNSATNVSDGRIRGLDLQSRSNGNIVAVYGIESNTRVSGSTCTYMSGIHHRCEIYGTVTTELYGVDVEMSNEGAAATTSAALLLRNTDASTGNRIGAAIRILNAGTNAGFDYAIDASASDCINTADFKFYDDGTVNNDTNGTGSATTAGYLTVVVGTATRYIWLANAAPTA